VSANFSLTLGTKKYSSGEFSGSGYVKGRGNLSWTQPQKPYSIKLEQKTSLLDIPATKRYAIVASYSIAVEQYGSSRRIAWEENAVFIVITPALRKPCNKRHRFCFRKRENTRMQVAAQNRFAVFQSYPVRMSGLDLVFNNSV